MSLTHPLPSHNLPQRSRTQNSSLPSALRQFPLPSHNPSPPNPNRTQIPRTGSRRPTSPHFRQGPATGRQLEAVLEAETEQPIKNSTTAQRNQGSAGSGRDTMGR